MKDSLAISIIDSRRDSALNRNVLEDSLMRWNRLSISIATAALACVAAPASAASFGSVVPLGGQASDIALDESRGRLYISNFTANRIDVMSTSDNTVHSSMNVSAQPGGLALSPDSRYLVVTNYANWGTGVPPAGANLVTVINLETNGRQTFSTGDPPLAAAFVNTTVPKSGQALIATTSAFYLLDPNSGTLQFLASYANVAKALPVPQATLPAQVVQATMSASADGAHIWGIADAGTGTQFLYTYDRDNGRIAADVWTTTPPLLPRLSVASDGSWALVGWSLYARAQCAGSNFMVRARYPGAIASPNITGHAVDSKSGLIYAQIADPTQPAGPPFAGKLPTLSILDSDNLTVRDKIYIPENLVGRAMLNSAASTMYAISDSGIMVLPVGLLNKAKRLTTSVEDLLVQSNFCNRNAMKQSFVISDLGNNRTDFTVSTSQAGVTISPSSGTTPATVTVTVDPAAMQNTFGTLAVPLVISSLSAVNAPAPVRLLISNPDQDQRGSIVNVPGVLADLVADTARNRFYIVRQDKNQVLVFDGINNQQIATLRTGTTPKRIAITNDSKSLLIASTDSQLVQMYDLDTLQPQLPIQLPSGHYGRSLAHSNASAFVVVENDAAPPGSIDRLDLQSHCAVAPLSLGIWANTMNPEAVLTTSPSQSTILLTEPDGNIKLYDAQSDTWVLSRKDFTALSGAFAASDSGTYVVGNNVLNQALVPVGTLDSAVGNTVGFAFTGQAQAGLRVTGNTASGPGVIQNMPASTGALVKPVRVTEAPILSTTAVPFTRTTAPMPNAGSIVVMTTSGFTVLAGNYDQAVAPPSIASIVNAADGTKPVAPGGLISIYGSNLAATNVATSTVPLSTALGQSCLVVNGTLAPLLFVSNGQVNAQLPSRANGNATLTIHTPGGVSDNYNFNVSANAPSVFQSGSAGPQTSLATIVRADDNQLVTPTNPIHTNDTIVIYLTGLGATSPAVDDGMPAPLSPLASAIVSPNVTLGGKPLSIYYAGLAPGFVGVYQINATVPFGVPQGLDIPLVIEQGGNSTSLPVRVVK
jgi:uncharacterized protein (TIGR03437 family)